jgi:phospholipid/cholesterol/gamma-HCH transport system substrate-binding protein
MTAKLRTRLVGGGLLFLFAGIIALVLALYSQAFTPAVNVSLLTDRAGLMMAPQDEVKVHGVVVGSVGGVSPHGKSAALITLRLDPGQTYLIPANAVARIIPNTVFGNKYISLAPPAAGGRGTVRAGTVLVSDHVATEVNTVFGNLVNVLNAASPAAVNTALTALATALQGQGPQLGQFLTGADTYLAEFNKSLPGLNTDITKTAQVSDLYADVAPRFFDILDNGDKVGTTLADRQQALDALLKGVTRLSQTGTTLASENGRNLVQALRLLEPTSSLLNEYSPELTCFIQGEGYAEGLLKGPVGGNGGAQAIVNLLPGKDPYKYPENLPQVNVKEGPHCYGLPYLGNSPAPFYPVPGAGYGNINTSTDPSLKAGNPPASLLPLGTSNSTGGK